MAVIDESRPTQGDRGAVEEIAGDEKALPTRRARALEGLVAIGAPNASKILRGCLDLIETLVRQPQENVTQADVETTINVLYHSMQEIDDETPASTAFVQSIKNAAGRLQDLRRELAAK